MFLKLLVVIAAGAVLLGVAMNPQTYAASPQAPEVNAVHHNTVHIGDAKAAVELNEIVQGGKIQGYEARVLDRHGEVLGSLPVTRAEGERVHRWLKRHHVFKTAGSLLRQLGAQLIKL